MRFGEKIVRMRAFGDGNATTAVALDRQGLDILVRWIPRNHWVRLFVSTTREFEPGRTWLYAGSIRRSAWRIGRLGFGMMRCPRVKR